MANIWLRDLKSLHLLLASIFSMVGSQNTGTIDDDASLFERSKALSSTSWEQYKTESEPSTDLMQCLARCELHENDANHPG